MHISPLAQNAARLGRSPDRAVTILFALTLLAGCSSGAAPGADAAPRTDTPTALDAAPPTDASPDSRTPADVVIPDDVPTRQYTYVASTATIANPERGFHRFIYLREPDDLGTIRRAGYTLVQANVLLDDARGVDMIPASVLAEITRGFAAVRAAGLKVMPRFLYDDSAGGNDAPLARVLGHITQLRPVLRANADIIAVMPAGFVGAWGEWHSSANNLDAPDAARQIIAALLDALPADRMLQVRTPAQKVALFGAGPLDAALAYGGTPAARVGHHNDCFLANDTDEGTYPDGELERWLTWLAAETQYLPFGGETCAVDTRSACPNALTEMARLHATHVNLDYHPDVIAGWRSNGCFDTIDRSLGYRLVLLSAALPTNARTGQSFRVQLQLRNAGWAAPLNPRPVVLSFEQGGRVYDVPLDGVDWRRWAAGMTTTVDHVVTLPAAVTAGAWRVLLRLPDASADLQSRPEYAVRFANDNTWDATLGANVLATLAVE